MDWVYLNGAFVEPANAMVSVSDRGFLLGDACYEATPYYGGKALCLEGHLSRLEAGLQSLRIPYDVGQLAQVQQALIERNGLTGAPLSMVYAHVTRGAAPRSHGFPTPAVEPTVYLFAKEVQRSTREDFEKGYRAITHDDERWAKPFIKTTNLLPNVIAQQSANEAGAHDVIFHRANRVTEGTHNNVFIVSGGTLITAPADDWILHGISRQIILEKARQAGIETQERDIDLTEVFDADEVFFTGTTTEVRPTVEVDGRRIGAGSAGQVTRAMYRSYCLEAGAESVIG